MNDEEQPAAPLEPTAEPETPAERRAAVRVLRSKVDPNDPVCGLLRRALSLAAEGKITGVAIAWVGAGDEPDEMDMAQSDEVGSEVTHALCTGARQLEEVLRHSLYSDD